MQLVQDGASAGGVLTRSICSSSWTTQSSEKRKTRLARGGFCSSGGGIRTRDLRVMSPTSYLTAPPRGDVSG